MKTDIQGHKTNGIIISLVVGFLMVGTIGANYVKTNDSITTSTPFIDVRAFGAAGDGITDDTVSIKNAVSSLGSNGGIIYFPQGTYKTTSPINITMNNVTIFSSNAIIKPPTTGFNVTGDNVLIKEIIIDGGNQATLDSGVILNGTNNTLFHTKVVGFYAPVQTGWVSRHTSIIDNFLQSTTNTGINAVASLNYGADGIIRDNYMVGTATGGSFSSGIYLHSSTKNYTVDGNTIQCNGCYDGISIRGNHHIIHGNKIYDVVEAGIITEISNYIDISDNTIIGSLQWGIFTNSDNFATRYVTIENNNVDRVGAPNFAGIEVRGSTDVAGINELYTIDAVVSGNIVNSSWEGIKVSHPNLGGTEKLLRVIVTNNMINSQVNGIETSRTQGTVINSNNVNVSGTSTGIRTYICVGCVINNNVVQNASVGILYFSSTNSTIVGNTIVSAKNATDTADEGAGTCNLEVGLNNFVSVTNIVYTSTNCIARSPTMAYSMNWY